MSLTIQGHRSWDAGMNRYFSNEQVHAAIRVRASHTFVSRSVVDDAGSAPMRAKANGEERRIFTRALERT